MADLNVMPLPEQRALLARLLVQRGLTPDGAADHVAWLREDAAIRNDLAFHLREDEAVKRGTPLPAYEVVRHYTGPMHRLDLTTAEEMAANSSPVPTPNLASQAPQTAGISALLTPRTVVAGLIGALGLAVFGYAVTLALANPTTPSEPQEARRGR